MERFALLWWSGFYERWESFVGWDGFEVAAPVGKLGVVVGEYEVTDFLFFVPVAFSGVVGFGFVTDLCVILWFDQIRCWEW